jgi:thiamine pyrophosphokinase
LETLEYPASMTAVILTGGEAPDPEQVREACAGASMVIAADSGLDTAIAAKVEVDLVVGDFDSLSSRDLLRQYGDAVREYPAAKDHTDTEIAVQAARDAGAERVVIVGGGGGRLDHLVGILRLFEREDGPNAWLTREYRVERIDTGIVLSGRIGDVVSFFPVGGDVCEMSSSGLRWNLDGLRWGRGDMGISNEFASPRVEVQMKSGRLVMIKPQGGQGV